MLQPADSANRARSSLRPDSHFEDLRRKATSALIIRRSLKLLLQAAIVAGLLALFCLRAPQVEGVSMLPNIQDGTHVLINTLAYDFGRPIQRGDVVAFVQGAGNDRKTLLKRVVGLAGDRIALRAGRVILNGALLQEPYATLDDRSNVAEMVVPSGSVYVLGDNRARSDDSRAFGPVASSSIAGKAMWTIWPLNRIQPVR